MKKALFGAAVALIALSFTADAFAQSYNSQRARQDREYKSLSNATQRAYGTSSSSSSSSYKRK